MLKYSPGVTCFWGGRKRFLKNSKFDVRPNTKDCITYLVPRLRDNLDWKIFEIPTRSVSFEVAQ
jgi:hypothetical protein